MTNLEATELLGQLRDIAERTLHAAGPRYTPGVDPEAPNLDIDHLRRAGDALALSSAFRERVADLATGLQKVHEAEADRSSPFFGGRRVTYATLIGDLESLAQSASPHDARLLMLRLRRHLKLVQTYLRRSLTVDRQRVRDLEAPDGETETDADKRERLRQREAHESTERAARRLEDALDDVEQFARGHEGDALAKHGAALLLGEWGTGKTHFMCDLSLRLLERGSPVVLLLASRLRTDLPPLDAIAEATGLAGTGADLVSRLEATAHASGGRALILIDAINEADRDRWRSVLPKLLSIVQSSDDLAIMVSCRTPFDRTTIVDRIRPNMVTLRHTGFEEQEAAAKLEYFRYNY